MSDTSPAAARFYHESLRALPAAERLRIAASLSASVRRLAARLSGDKVAARYFPDVPLDATAR